MTMEYNPTRPKCDAKQLNEILRSGVALLVGEYRGFKVEKIDYVDKTTGKPASFIKCEMNVEVGNGSAVACEVRLPRGLDNPAGIALGLSKGQQIVLRLASIMEQKGRTVATVGAENEAVMILA